LKIYEIISFLNEVAPSEWQESYDNAGLIVGNENWNCHGVLVCLDSTEKIIDEAIQKECNLIIAHHPIIFSGLKKINGNHYIEKTIIKAIKNDIAIFAIHTNLDNAFRNGVNSKLAEKLELINTTVLTPKKEFNNSVGYIGAGLIGYLQNPMPVNEFFTYVKNKMEICQLKHTGIVRESINKIALCGGSGSFLIQKAKAENVDVYITSDIKYHEYFEANDEIIIMDIGHFESEKFTIELLYTLIQNKFSTFAVHFTNHNTNPVYYL
jgi:dinuclear metal center YbgI/SA1388 family protein